MAFYAYYLIRASASLTAALQSINTETSQELLTPKLWQNREGGRTAWRAADHTRRVKQAFVTYVARLLRDSDPELSQLLDLDAHSVEQGFDRWWTIERFEVDEEVSEVEKDLGLTPRIVR